MKHLNDARFHVWTFRILLAAFLCNLLAEADAQGNISPSAPAASASPSSNNFELSKDSQEFTFRSNSYRLTIPGGPSFAFPPGYQLPADLAAKLEQSGGALPVPTSDGGTAVLTGPVAGAQKSGSVSVASAAKPSSGPAAGSSLDRQNQGSVFPYIPNFEPPPTTGRPGTVQKPAPVLTVKSNQADERYREAGMGGYLAYGTRSFGKPNRGKATGVGFASASNDY